MPASPESVSNRRGRAPVRPEKILVVSPSWLGDSIMAMPALYELKRQAAGLRITVLAKPAVADVWGLCPAVDEVLEFETGWRGMRKAVREVAAGGFDFAYVIPGSFRSAWIPFLSRVPVRRGYPGHCRRWLLTEGVCGSSAGIHQSEEAFRLLGVEPGGGLHGPLVAVPEVERDAMRQRPGLSSPAGAAPLVAMFPGAARGPSKRWPSDRFTEVGRRLAAGSMCRVVLAGSAEDRAMCEEIAGRIGSGAVSLAGLTTLRELAALLSLCHVVIANDSGGMHLAAAVGTRVVALYGLTDPRVTGPLGDGHVVLMAPGVVRDRNIPRETSAARAALEAITADSVHAAVLAVLGTAR